MSVFNSMNEIICRTSSGGKVWACVGKARVEFRNGVGSGDSGEADIGEQKVNVDKEKYKREPWSIHVGRHRDELAVGI